MVTSRFNITQNSVKIFDSTLKPRDDQIAVRPGKLLTDFASNIMMLLEPTICFGFRPNAKNPTMSDHQKVAWSRGRFLHFTVYQYTERLRIFRRKSHESLCQSRVF
jgi:hypothetical protein